MNHKLVGCPRTWHSLWDEMFSAFTAFDADAENAGSAAELEWSGATCELKSWIIERSAQRSNDNGST